MHPLPSSGAHEGLGRVPHRHLKCLANRSSCRQSWSPVQNARSVLCGLCSSLHPVAWYFQSLVERMKRCCAPKGRVPAIAPSLATWEIAVQNCASPIQSALLKLLHRPRFAAKIWRDLSPQIQKCPAIKNAIEWWGVQSVQQPQTTPDLSPRHLQQLKLQLQLEYSRLVRSMTLRHRSKCSGEPNEGHYWWRLDFFCVAPPLRAISCCWKHTLQPGEVCPDLLVPWHAPGDLLLVIWFARKEPWRDALLTQFHRETTGCRLGCRLGPGWHSSVKVGTKLSPNHWPEISAEFGCKAFELLLAVLWGSDANLQCQNFATEINLLSAQTFQLRKSHLTVAIHWTFPPPSHLLWLRLLSTDTHNDRDTWRSKLIHSRWLCRLDAFATMNEWPPTAPRHSESFEFPAGRKYRAIPGSHRVSSASAHPRKPPVFQGQGLDWQHHKSRNQTSGRGLMAARVCEHCQPKELQQAILAALLLQESIGRNETCIWGSQHHLLPIPLSFPMIQPSQDCSPQPSRSRPMAW